MRTSLATFARTLACAVLVCIGFAVPVCVRASAFGLEKGMTLEQIGGAAQQVAPGKYKLATVPKPHSAFETYLVEVGAKTGLCWVKGVGKTVHTSAYGFEFKGAFEEMKSKLDKTYGTAELMDRLLPGSIWKEPNEWMMGLLQKERQLAAIWSEKSKATLPVDVKSVGLFATSLSRDTGFISVEYAFTNEAECDAEIAKKEDSAL